MLKQDDLTSHFSGQFSGTDIPDLSFFETNHVASVIFGVLTEFRNCKKIDVGEESSESWISH